MKINKEIERLVFSSEPLISFNIKEKTLFFYGSFRNYISHESYTDTLEHIATYPIGKNLIDFISTSDEVLQMIRNSSHSSKNSELMTDDNIGTIDSLYLYLIYNSPKKHTLTELYGSKLENLRLEFDFALDFCCNNEYNQEFKDLTTMQRYYLYTQMYPDNPYTNMTQEPRRIKEFKSDIKLLNLNNISIFRKFTDVAQSHAPITATYQLSSDIITGLSHINITPLFFYCCASVGEYLGVEFFKMIESDTKVKKCKNCGRYFILKGNYATEYCDHIPIDEKFSCKKIAARKARKDKLANNIIIKEYDTAYKRLHARVRNKTMSNEAFRIWTEDAIKERDHLVNLYNDSPPNDVLIEFKKYLGNKTS